MEEATHPGPSTPTLADELVKLAELVHELMDECEQLRRENAELRERI